MDRRTRHTQGGFTYVGMIVFVTIIGLVGAATLKVGALLPRAEAENELLETGAVFSAALASYAQATPPGQPSQPASLEALLRDPRFPVPLRHLRRIFVDPVTGSAEWGLVRAAEGGPILGVYSLSQAKPLKIANFDARFVNFEHKPHLSDWKFMADARVSTPAAAVPGQGATPPATMFPPPASPPPPPPPTPAITPVVPQLVPRQPPPPPAPEPAEAEDAKETEAEKEEEQQEPPPATNEPQPVPVPPGG